MSDDPVAEAFRQLERHHKTNEVPDLGVVTDAWIICALRHREIAARQGALQVLLKASPENGAARDELVRVERERKAIDRDLEIMISLRENISGQARHSRDYEAAGKGLAKLRRNTILRNQDEEKLRDDAAGWRGDIS